MATSTSGIDVISFSDFPEDVHLCILSFLSPTEISSFALTSKRFVSLCRDDDKLWHAMCDRRWGSKTEIRRWKNRWVSYKLLYKTLSEWENLIGFWLRCGQANSFPMCSPSLVSFDWGSSFLSGSRVYPSKDGTFSVSTSPFLYIGFLQDGRIVKFLDPDGNSRFVRDFEDLWLSEEGLIPVNLDFMGKIHFLVEEDRWFTYNLQEEMKNFRRCSPGDEREEVVTGMSPNGSIVTEWYTQVANKTSPGGDRRRQQRKEKERQVRARWMREHFVKVVDCCPTPSKPLQGLWKGFSDNTNLAFYYIKYDEVGGIICKQVVDLSTTVSVPVFWATTTAFVEPPFALNEFDGQIHLGPHLAIHHETAASLMLYINSNGDMIDDLPLEEGWIWVYKNGTLGFGFLRNHFIVDLKPVVEDGCLFDAVITSEQQ